MCSIRQDMDRAVRGMKSFPKWRAVQQTIITCVGDEIEEMVAPSFSSSPHLGGD